MSNNKRMLWCHVCNVNVVELLNRDRNLIHCGFCLTELVPKAKDGCCLICSKDTMRGFHCEGCHQRICVNHIMKRNVYGFGIWCCPYCWARTETKRRPENPITEGHYVTKYHAGYCRYTFDWDDKKGHYVWDGVYEKRVN